MVLILTKVCLKYGKHGTVRLDSSLFTFAGKVEVALEKTLTLSIWVVVVSSKFEWMSEWFKMRVFVYQTPFYLHLLMNFCLDSLIGRGKEMQVEEISCILHILTDEFWLESTSQLASERAAREGYPFELIRRKRVRVEKPTFFLNSIQLAKTQSTRRRSR